ncbi:MerR family transcriptional regulator [Bartonella sp. HY406]|uniref:MerR family transcriptional regulator n=1 Tax=Bartonella sp. HY406 TaxID=2979331 RepID=UPI0021C6BED2|nr:MerR family transcriptional regulator [Bartonella sp. HY406]UXN04228.1 MerR family transcriptional regulator [Bartonella sp. HY406]
MKIGELAQRSGLSCHTIRYYERIGLLPYADRDGGGQRDYDKTILTWVCFLKNLKATGMPLAQMLEYATLRDKGDASITERRQKLEQHRKKVAQDIKQLQENLQLLDKKIIAYQTIEQEIEQGTTNTDLESRFRQLAKS